MLLIPKSGEQLVQIAPNELVAKKATIASGELGNMEQTRSPFFTPQDFK